MKRALIHRYDNKPDIEAVAENGCSDVFRRAKDNDFELVIVIPTGSAKTDLAVYADATSEQYIPETQKKWPGRPDLYIFRTDVENVQETTLENVKRAIKEAGNEYLGAWTVRVVDIEEHFL